jgi:tetratricopeptide (TPR) repeat protein
MKSNFQLAIAAYNRLMQKVNALNIAPMIHITHTHTTEEATDEKRAVTWLTRALAMESSQQYEAAIAAFSQIVQLQPHDPFAWLRRGTLLEKVGCLEDALTSYDQVVRLQPDNYWVWCNRGRILQSLERFEDAAIAYRRALKIRPDCSTAMAGFRSVSHSIRQRRLSA